MEVDPLHQKTIEFFSNKTDILLNKLVSSETEAERNKIVKELNSLKIRLSYELKQLSSGEF